MVGSNGTMIAIRLVRSKLRKREDAAAHNSVHPEQVQVSSVGAGLTNPALSDSSPSLVESCCPAAAPAPGGCVGNNPHDGPAANIFAAAAATQADHFIWQFPPPYPPPNTPPPQYTLYNDQDTLVHGHGQGFAKGFRKNLGGRWRRLVKRKPESETCAIPPELKDQLKTIYVY